MALGWKKQEEPTPTPAPPAETQETAELGTAEPFEPETPRRRFADLVVPPAVRSRIEAAVGLIRFHKTLYETWNLKKVDPDRSGIAINLFGPPGTGKTFCAEAIAQFLRKRIIKVNYAEIESKYVGETPKNITAAFRRARETDAVLFFDESDSILGKRLTQITQSADHGVNVSRAVMLTQLDKFSGVVIFATNLARNYDGAFVRRILAHIEFELPDSECRQSLWQLLMPSELPKSTEVEASWLAAESEGLSGGDILNVIIASACLAVQRKNQEQRVTRRDLLVEIEAVRIAKSKIGLPEKEHTQRTLLHPDELPADARERFDAAVGATKEDASQLTTNTRPANIK